MKKLNFQKILNSGLITIEKLLNERPDIKGITVPGMPSGINVPGMEVSNERAKFDVLAVNNDGSTFVWKSYE